MDVLVVAAHPDDEILGCGATLARHTAEGDRVHMLILGQGARARVDASSEDGGALRSAAIKAGAAVGAVSVEVLDYPDNRFDTVARLDLVREIESQISAVKPAVVYTHHAGDVNVDHVEAALAVLAATRPMPACPVKSLYAFETFSSTEWAFGGTNPWQPDYFVDVESFFESKLDALGCYEAEMRTFPHPRSVEAITAAARRWGSAVGVPMAEAFMTVRTIR